MVQVFTLGISGSQGTQHQGFFIICSLYLYPSTVAFTKQLLIGSLYPLPLLCCVIFFNSSLHHENHWRCECRKQGCNQTIKSEVSTLSERKNSQGSLLQALRQGKLSSLVQLNTALKTDFVRPENDAESNSKDNTKNLKRGWPDYFGKFL